MALEKKDLVEGRRRLTVIVEGLLPSPFRFIADSFVIVRFKGLVLLCENGLQSVKGERGTQRRNPISLSLNITDFTNQFVLKIVYFENHLVSKTETKIRLPRPLMQIRCRPKPPINNLKPHYSMPLRVYSKDPVESSNL